jgi:hypothetical protein
MNENIRWALAWSGYAVAVLCLFLTLYGVNR